MRPPRGQATDDELAGMCAVVDEAMARRGHRLFELAGPEPYGRPRPTGAEPAGRPGRDGGAARQVAASGRGIAEVTYGPLFDIEEVAQISKDLGVRITWGSLLTGLFGAPGAAMEMLERATAVGGDLWPQVSCREIVFQMSLLSPYFFSEVAGFNE